MIMKRIPQSFFLALFVFAISSFAQTQPRLAAPEELWKEFSSTAGRFKVALPGKPTETSQTTESRVGKIERHTFTFVAGFATCLVTYSDFPITLNEPGEIKKFLDHMHEGEVASSQGKLLSMTEIELGGYPGREFTVETPNSTFRMRHYLVGQRFYQLAISTPTAGFLAADMQRLANDLEKQGQKELAQIFRGNDSAKNAAGIAGSLEVFAARFFDSFKLTGQPAVGKKTIKAIAVDEKGKAVAVKKIDPGSALKKVAPAYPAEAKAAGVSGKVEVQVTISEKGQVIEAIAVSGPELLREAAEQAAKQWVFKPAKADRRPVKVQGIMIFNFTLQ
jgi:TonB family protein